MYIENVKDDFIGSDDVDSELCSLLCLVGLNASMRGLNRGTI